jgi:hypothetical protein
MARGREGQSLQRGHRTRWHCRRPLTTVEQRSRCRCADRASELAITGATPRLDALDVVRPLTMRLLTAGGTVVSGQTPREGEDDWTPVVPAGDWQWEEQTDGPAVRRSVRVDPELQGVWGLLWLTVAPDQIPNGQIGRRPERVTSAMPDSAHPASDICVSMNAESEHVARG